MPPKKISAAVSLVAAALILLQISFTRLISYKLFYHFVFLAIALSLLGLGAAGTFVAVSRDNGDGDQRMRRWLAVLAGLTPVALVAMANPPFATHSELHVKLLGNDALIYLGWCAVFMVALNFAGGVVLTLAFKRYSARMGFLYVCDLVGAGLGCLLAVGLMKYFSPPAAFLFASVLSVAALAMLAGRAASSAGRSLAGVCGVLSLAVVGAIYWAPQQLTGLEDFGRSPSDTGSGKPVPLIKHEWNHIIRTDHSSTGMYVLDGEAATPVVRWDERQQNLGMHDPVYALVKPEPAVAVIGFGGGPQIAEARRAQASHITAIDINPTISRWVKHEDLELNLGLFDAPNIEIVNDEGRHAMAGSSRKFDVIVMHAIDTYAATAGGAYALSENFLYTKEALKDYLGALNPGGVMTIQRWLFNPPRENLRLFATALEAFEELGYEHPERHIMMLAPVQDFEKVRTEQLRVWGFLMISPTPFSERQLAQTRRYLRRAQETSLYTPGGNENTAFNAYVQAPDREAFRRAYPYVIKPVTDSSPYLFQYYNPFDASAYRVEGDWATSGIYQSSAVTLLATFAIAVAASFLLILFPLAWVAWRSRGPGGGRAGLSTRSLVFFATLGVGFMALEVPLTQVLALYLGHPVFGFSVVLVALLLSSGVGSLLCERLTVSRWHVCALIAGLLALLTAGIFPFVHGTIQLPDFARFPLALMLVVACGLPMGFPLALAVRELGKQNPTHVAWAWGVNGAASVVGSCVVMIVMVFLETRYALVLGAACYALAAAVSYRRTQPALATASDLPPTASPSPTS